MNHPEHQIVACAMLLAAATAAGACTKASSPTPHVPGPMASALLAFAGQQGVPAADVAQAWKVVDAIADRIASRRPGAGEDAIDNMNAVVFTELGFVREVQSTDPSFLLLPSVVKGRRGGCLGLGALYLALAERLGLPLAGVMVPGHFFVRSVAPHVRNVELLRGGEAMPDDWYVRKYGPFAGATQGPNETTAVAGSSYMRPLEIQEVIAVHWFNIGNHRRADGDYESAAQAYTRATDEFPAFAEAAANLGAVRHLQGDLQAAAQSYGVAARAQPDLPGLTHNLAILEAERSTFGLAPLARPFPRTGTIIRKHESGESPRRSSP